MKNIGVKSRNSLSLNYFVLLRPFSKIFKFLYESSVSILRRDSFSE